MLATESKQLTQQFVRFSTAGAKRSAALVDEKERVEMLVRGAALGVST